MIRKIIQRCNKIQQQINFTVQSLFTYHYSTLFANNLIQRNKKGHNLYNLILKLILQFLLMGRLTALEI